MQRVLNDEVGTKVLRPNQFRVMQDLCTFFTENDKGYIAMPTGSGKTVMFANVLASHDIKSLVVVPTKQLIEQTIEELKNQGIDKVITTVDTRSVTGKQTYANAQVVVTTYAQLVRSAGVPWGIHTINPADYGMVILDEAHHAMADGATGALREFNHAFQIGFTATPDYSEARLLKENLPTVIHELSISEAIETKLITPFANAILLTNADMSDVQSTAKDYDSRKLDKVINTPWRNTAIAEFVATGLRDKKVIISCNTVDHAQAVAAALIKSGVEADAVHGGLSSKELQAALQDFKSGVTQVLCNNKLLTEGFDDPSVDVVINASPTMSRVRQQQRVGRGLRLNANKPYKELLIIDCIDRDYKKRPTLFFDKDIAGQTGLSTASPDTHQLLESARSMQPQPGLVLIDDEVVTSFIGGLIRPKTPQKRAARTNTGSRLSILGAGVLDRVLQRATDRKYEIGSGDTSFRDLGLCAQTDPEVFYPERGGSTQAAKRICMDCEVREDCLEYALENGERYGVWGGLSERERRKIGKTILTFAD